MSTAKITYFVACFSLFSTGAMLSATRLPFSRFADFQAPLPPIDPDADQDEALRCMWAERYWNETPDRQMRSDWRVLRLDAKMLKTVFEQRCKEEEVRRILAQESEESKIQAISHTLLTNKARHLYPKLLAAVQEQRRQVGKKERMAAKQKLRRTS